MVFYKFTNKEKSKVLNLDNNLNTIIKAISIVNRIFIHYIVYHLINHLFNLNYISNFKYNTFKFGFF